MSEIQPSCKSLPFEVLHKVIESADIRELPNYALVCKAWSRPVQSVLFSSVELYKFSHLRSFYDSVMRNPHLGGYVKDFQTHPFDADDTEETIELMTNLFYSGLPNLQQVHEYALDTYVPLLNALKNSRLKKLKKFDQHISLSLGEEEQKNYVSCILLMRDRVQRIRLVHNGTDELISNSLYKILDKLTVLGDLKISCIGAIQWFPVLEYLTTCRALKRIDITFRESPDKKDVNINVIVPCPRIEALQILIWNGELLMYIMHKFPQLREFSTFFLYQLKPQEFVGLLDYVSRIDSLLIQGIFADSLNSKAVMEYWDSLSPKLGQQIVHMNYSECRNNDLYQLTIMKSKDKAEPIFSIKYDPVEFFTQHNDTIDEIGKYIGVLHFSYQVDNDTRFPICFNLPSQFMDDLITRCPNLHTLHFAGWLFREKDLPQGKISITELGIHHCVIHDSFFRQLSPVLPQLERLILQSVSYNVENVQTPSGSELEYAMDSALVVDMQQTTIDSITIYKEDYLEHPHIKFFVASKNEYYYYPSNEVEYERAKVGNRISIRCLNKPKIQFKCNFGFSTGITANYVYH